MVNEIGRSGLNSILGRLLTIKGGAPAPVLGPEIVPAITLESDRPEYHFLAGSRLMAARAELTRTAAVSTFQLKATEGTLVVLDYVTVSVDHVAMATAPACCEVYVNSLGNVADGPATMDQVPMDARWGTPWAASCTVNELASTTGLGISVDHANINPGALGNGNNVQLLKGYPVILGPGQQAIVVVGISDSDADFCECFLNFRVRPIEPNELRGG